MSPAHKAAPLGLAILLACMSMLSPFSIDTFFPSFRAMQDEFGVSALQMQQTLTLYLLPYAIMSLFHGPLSDALGRRKVVLVGLGAYVAASLACMLAPGFVSLLAFRACQGLSAGAGMVVSRAVVRDLYHGAAAQRLMSVMTMIFGLAPAIAPIMGGWIHVWFGWRGVFALLVLLSVSLLFMCFWKLPETHPLEKRVPLDLRGLIVGSWRVATDRGFLLLALSSAASFSTVLVFVASAPAIVLDHWKLSETQFGWMFVPMISGMMGGAWLSGRMAGRLAPQRQVAIGFALSFCVSAAVSLAHIMTSHVSVLLQQLGLVVLAMGAQLAAPVLAIAMLDRFPQVRGTAASVQSFITLVWSTMVMGFVATQLQGSMLFITGFGVLGSGLGYLLWRAAIRAGVVPQH